MSPLTYRRGEKTRATREFPEGKNPLFPTQISLFPASGRFEKDAKVSRPLAYTKRDPVTSQEVPPFSLGKLRTRIGDGRRKIGINPKGDPIPCKRPRSNCSWRFLCGASRRSYAEHPGFLASRTLPMRSIQEFSSDLRQSARAERDCSSSKHSERNASRGYACPEGRSFRGFPRTKLFVFRVLSAF